MKQYYKTLQVSRNASPQEIKEQYRSLVREYHPDKFHTEEEKQVAQERFVEINDAYNALKASFPAKGPSVYIDPNQPPMPVPSRTLLDFGQMSIGTRKTITFVVQNDGGPVESVRFDYDQDKGWIKVEEQITEQEDGKFPLVVAVTVDTEKMPPQSAYQDTIDIWLNDQMARVTLVVAVTKRQQLLRYFAKISPQFAAMVLLLIAMLAGIFALAQSYDGPIIIARGTSDEMPATVIQDDGGGGEEASLASPLIFSRGSEQKMLYILHEMSGDPYSLQLNGYAPVWSPSAQKIAFLRDTDAGSHIYTADLVVTQPLASVTELSRAGFGGFPMRTSADTTALVQLQKFAASEASQLTSSSDQKFDLTWSPDGQQIAYREQFTSDDGTVTAILKAIDLQEGTEMLLSIPAQGSVTHITWAQDNQSLYVTFDRDGNEKIYVVDATSGLDEAFVQFEGRDVAWSPDGNFAAIASDQGIYLRDQEQDTVERLSSFPSWEPMWSPDGSKLAFFGIADSSSVDVLPASTASLPKENADLWTLDVDTGITTQLTRTGVRNFVWDSSSKKLIFTSAASDAISDTFYIWQIEPGMRAEKLAEIGAPHIAWLAQ